MSPQRASVIPLARVAVRATGLHRAAPFGRGRPGALEALRRLGYLQIDTISVVRRAHEHVLASRVPGFQPRHLDELIRRREAFEYWAHAAAFLPMEDFRHALPRMQRLRAGGQHWIGRDARVMDEVLDRIRDEGPLQSRDFDAPDGHRGGWWSWKPAKRALERLFHEGALMVVERDGFAKSWDLTERVLPAHVDTRPPSLQAHADHLIERARLALGVFRPPHVTYLRRESGLRPAVAAGLAAAVEAGRLTRVRAAERDWYVDRESLQTTARISNATRFLSPFDPLVLHRDRLARLFGFDFQLECYLPAPRRRYGYFSLPILQGATFIGRADCKAERATGRFLIRHLALEPGTGDRADIDALGAQLLSGAAQLAALDDCDQLRVERISGLTKTRAGALKQRLAGSIEAS